MKKLSKRAAIFIAVGSVVAAAAISIPVGVIYGSSSAGTSAATLVMLDRTRNSHIVTWGTEPASIKPPALTAEETDAPGDYESGEFVSSNLTEATLPGAEGVNVTFLFKSKSSNRPALQITYSLDVVKAIPAKP